MIAWFKSGGVFVALVGVLMLLPHTIHAHATPISYTPPPGTTLIVAPRVISIKFTERIEPDASSLKVFAPSGEEIQLSKGSISTTDERVFETEIKDGGLGVYTVSWQVVSVDDGHFTKGAHSFLVDTTGKKFEGNAGGVQITYVTRFPEAVFSFFSLLGETLFLAIVFFLIFIVRPIYKKYVPSLIGGVSDVLRHLSIFGILFLLFGSLTTIVKKTTLLAELQSASFGDTLFVYLSSSSGIHTLLKLTLGFLFVGMFLVFRSRIFNSSKVTFAEWFMLLFVLGIMYAQSASSHAAASLFYPKVSIALTMLHLFAKELVIGAAILLFVLFIFHQRRNIWDGWKSVLPRFDFIMAFMIMLAGVSGVFVTWLHLKRPENLFETEWGMRFVLLLLLTVALGLVRILHQFFIHRWFFEKKFFQKLYEITLPTEVLLGLLVLFFSGYISLTTPPFVIEEFAYKAVAESQGVKIILDSHPYEHDALRVSTFLSESGAPLDPTSITVTATHDKNGIGPNVLPLEKRATGSYVFPMEDLSPAGEWNVDVIVGQSKGYDARRQFKITYPDDIEKTRFSDDERTFDRFAFLMCVTALAIVFVSLILMGESWIRVRRNAMNASVAIKVETLSPMRRNVFAGIFIFTILIFVYVVYSYGVVTDFHKRCIADGFLWQQAFPTRNLQAVSPNAWSGCFVHGGHYHFILESEYETFLKSE